MSSSDPWAQAARLFYGRRTPSKVNQKRYRSFVSAYRAIAKLVCAGRHRSFLDVGCGCGELAASLSETVGLFCGIDVCLESLIWAQKKNPRAFFVQADMTALPMACQFDCASAVSSLEFCCNKSKALAEIHAALKPDGRFYLEVRNADFIVFKILAPLSRWLRRSALLTPYPADGFCDLDIEEWTRLIESSGFRIVETTRSMRPVCYGSLFTRGKNLLIKAVSGLTPLRHHYMIGFLCLKDNP